MTYEIVRDFSVTYGFVFMGLVYAATVLWAFRRRSTAAYRQAARMIFAEDEQQASAKETAND